MRTHEIAVRLKKYLQLHRAPVVKILEPYAEQIGVVRKSYSLGRYVFYWSEEEYAQLLNLYEP